MVNVFSHEATKARVNITLEVETGGAKKKKELPMKLLVLADFTKKDKTQLANKEKIKINKNNFDAVVKELTPQLHLITPNKIVVGAAELQSTLNFQAMKDFLPQNIALQIPELRQLIAMRNLLKDLKTNIADNPTLGHELDNVIQDQKQINNLKAELQKLIP